MVRLYACATVAHCTAFDRPGVRRQRAACCTVCDTGLEPLTSRPLAGLLLTRLSLALDRQEGRPAATNVLLLRTGSATATRLALTRSLLNSLKQILLSVAFVYLTYAGLRLALAHHCLRALPALRGSAFRGPALRQSRGHNEDRLLHRLRRACHLLLSHRLLPHRLLPNRLVPQTPSRSSRASVC